MSVRTAALVGVVGGAGTTRTAVELAGALARAERSVLVFDLDFATQGLSRSVSGRIEPDATALLADPSLDLADAAISWSVEGPGRLDVLPAYAPFVDVAAAKTVEAAERVGDRLREATGTYDHVLLDVPPIVSNQAIGGVDAADRVAAAFPGSDRGLDALQRTKGRLEDVGSPLDVAIATRTMAADAPPDADAAVPLLPAKPAPDRPVALEGSGEETVAVAEAAATLFELELEIESAQPASSMLERVRGRLS
ncbi:MAG: ParA family protein [Halanaeroarchaeum sp.]